MNQDQFDLSKSLDPGTGDFLFPGKVSKSDTVGCDGNARTSGSVTLESEDIGFDCDDPKSPGDVNEVECAKDCPEIQIVA